MTTQPGYSEFDRDFDGQSALDDGYISEEEQIRRIQNIKLDLIYEEIYYEPYIYYLRSQYFPHSIPNYFKRDHPGDDLFMNKLIKLQHPDDEEAIESIMKRTVTEIIWKDTGKEHKSTWNNKEEMGPLLYTSVIEAAAGLVYFLYPPGQLYRIGCTPAIHDELDEIWDQLKGERSYNEVCTLANQLISRNDKYQLVSEEYIDDMLFEYPDNKNYPRFKCPGFFSFTAADEKAKDQLYVDIANVVNNLKPPPFDPHEYTHWMMTFLRGNAVDVEDFLETEIIEDQINCPKESPFHIPIEILLNELLYKAKRRLKQHLLSVVQPMIKICKPVGRDTARVIIEIVEVAEIIRVATGAQFIGQSHLIWAFYKLGYALPLKCRKTIERFDFQDKGHPPYHIYMAAAKLALKSGHKHAILLHFIYAVLNSDVVEEDGRGLARAKIPFGKLKKDFEKTEKEIRAKDTVTVRPCPAVDAHIEKLRKRSENY